MNGIDRKTTNIKKYNLSVNKVHFRCAEEFCKTMNLYYEFYPHSNPEYKIFTFVTNQEKQLVRKFIQKYGLYFKRSFSSNLFNKIVNQNYEKRQDWSRNREIEGGQEVKSLLLDMGTRQGDIIKVSALSGRTTILRKRIRV